MNPPTPQQAGDRVGRSIAATVLCEYDGEMDHPDVWRGTDSAEEFTSEMSGEDGDQLAAAGVRYDTDD